MSLTLALLNMLLVGYTLNSAGHWILGLIIRFLLIFLSTSFRRFHYHPSHIQFLQTTSSCPIHCVSSYFLPNLPISLCIFLKTTRFLAIYHAYHTCRYLTRRSVSKRKFLPCWESNSGHSARGKEAAVYQYSIWTNGLRQPHKPHQTHRTLRNKSYRRHALLQRPRTRQCQATLLKPHNAHQKGETLYLCLQQFNTVNTQKRPRPKLGCWVKQRVWVNTERHQH